MRSKDITINGDKFTLTELGNYGFSIGIRQWKEKFDKNHFIIKTVHSKFDKDNFSFPHTPLYVSEISNTTKFSRQNNIKVLDMPIKFPGSSDYSLPKELAQFDEAISKIVAFEHNINPYVNQYYAYLTIDQEYLPSYSYQRKSGCHTDGFQGASVKNKRPINRSYIIYDQIPTVFYPQKFIASHLDEKVDNFFLSFDSQADRSLAITFDPYSIILMNAYTVHRSALASYSTYRTFLRVSYDTMMYNRLGNTHNPMFDYKWDMIIKSVPQHLRFRPLPNFLRPYKHDETVST